MKNLPKILLIGCGQLGSRHLQALAGLDNIKDVHIVDINPDSLDLGRLRLKETPDLNPNIKFQWFSQINQESRAQENDLCIVATQAKGRCELIKRIADQLGYRNFIVEKIVSQSIGEYLDLMDFSGKKDLRIWVNCKTRAYAIHKYIKSLLNPSEAILLTDAGGNHGLANNGIHSADLFVFFDGAQEIKEGGIRIDPLLHPSKRGEDLYDLSGTLCGYSQKGSRYILSFDKNHNQPNQISIVTSQWRFIIDHFKKIAFESNARFDWQWKEIRLEENYLVSRMTRTFASDILSKGRCDLPTLRECFPAHEFILKTLLVYFNRLRKSNENYSDASPDVTSGLGRSSDLRRSVGTAKEKMP